MKQERENRIDHLSDQSRKIHQRLTEFIMNNESCRLDVSRVSRPEAPIPGHGWDIEFSYLNSGLETPLYVGNFDKGSMFILSFSADSQKHLNNGDKVKEEIIEDIGFKPCCHFRMLSNTEKNVDDFNSEGLKKTKRFKVYLFSDKTVSDDLHQTMEMNFKNKGNQTLRWLDTDGCVIMPKIKTRHNLN